MFIHKKETKFEKRGRRLDTVKRAWQTNPHGVFENKYGDDLIRKQ